jgi:hypothetical protein
VTVTYFDRSTEVEIGDRVELRALFTKERGAVVYVPGKTARNPNLERDGLAWVGIRLDGGGFTGAIVNPEARHLEKSVRFLERGSATELPADEDPFAEDDPGPVYPASERSLLASPGAIDVRLERATPVDLAIASHGSGSLGRNLALSFGLFLGLGAFVWFFTGSLAWSIGLGGAPFALSVWGNLSHFRMLARRRERAATTPEVEILEVDARRVIEVEPAGDHEPAWLFVCDDGHLLLLVGQWLREQRGFPSLTFTFRRWADTGRPIRIEPRSPRVEPEPLWLALTGVHRPPHALLFSGDLDDLQASFDAALARADAFRTPV